MKRFLLVLLLALGSYAHGQSPPTSSAGTGRPTLRVAFWNIQWFPGRHPNPSRTAERSQIAAVHRDMRGINPDIMGMEEVRDLGNAGIAIAPLPGFKVDVVSNFEPREGQDVGQQVAIASRLKPISAWYEAWKAAGPLTPPRGFAFGAYETAPGHLILVYAVHLKSNRGEVTEDIAIRQEAMRQLCAHMTAMNSAYGKLGLVSWVVGGDFNTAPDDRRFARESTLRMLTGSGFTWCWQNVPFANRITLPADKFYPAACFDHIFVRNANLLSAQAIMTSPQSSDHHAIVAELQM